MQKKRIPAITALLLLFILTLSSIYADEVSSDDIKTAACRWISANAIFKLELPNAEPITATRMTNADGSELPLWHVKLSPSGYLIMSSDDTLPPVVAFDTKASYSQSSPTPLPLMLDKQGEIFQEELVKPQTRGNRMAQENQARWQALLSPTRAESVMPSIIITSPMLDAEWHQDAPFNYLCPSAKDYYDSRAAAGCVPLSIAQVLSFHEWPVAGTGTKTYKDDEGELTASLKADYSFPYDWQSISEARARFRNATTLTGSELAVSRLIMEMGVLVNADYELEETGAYTKDVERIKDYLFRNLKYANNIEYGDTFILSPRYVGQSVLYSRIRRDMSAGRPALVDYSGHQFVADGLGNVGGLDYYHFNYGWGGLHNGWYLLADGYHDTVVTSATTNIQPKPVAVFRTMSFEQYSTFMLSWDFPKHIKADMFRLTRTQGATSTVISSSIDGSSSSYAVTGQSGLNIYTLEAKVNGEWQEASKGIAIMVVNNPSKQPVLALDDVLDSRKGATVTTNIASNVPLESLAVSSGRPDILPDSSITVTGNGTSWTLKLAPKSQSVGNVLLYLTAADGVGNIVKQTVLLRVIGVEKLVWHDNFDEALQAALDARKMLLLVEDFGALTDSHYLCQNICETDDIKEYLQENYVLWYADWYYDWDSDRYTNWLFGSRPCAVIIDPDDTSRGLRSICNPSKDEFREFMNLDTPVFSMDDKETYALGTVCQLRISCLRKNAVIRYRLDSNEPTIADMACTEPLSLTETTTVTVRAFLGGEPVSDVISKTFTFQPQVALPELSVSPSVFFIGSCLLTADCDTPGATIRYRTDGTTPDSSCPVFPQDGLTVEKSCEVVVIAFKEGMKESEAANRTVTALTEFNAAEIVNSGHVMMYSTGIPWFLQTNTFHTSPSAMQSAAIGNSESTSMIGKVTGSGTIAFYWKASSEETYDELSFSIDGVQQDVVSGDTEWEQKSYTISGEGEHFLAWTYSKDSLGCRLNDCAWIDDIRWITAEDATPESAFEYNVTNGVVTITKFIGSQADVSIPMSIAGYPVVAIGDSAFLSCTNLASITIPEHVQTISSNAFEDCTKLQDVDFNGGVPSLGTDSFPTPITFHVFPGKGWEDYMPPAGVTVQFDMLQKLTLNLSRGWNLCSLPFMPDEDSIFLLNEAGSAFWRWENGRFKQLDNFLPGQGFWMYVQSACELKLKGVEGDAVPLRKGWNLVGPTTDNPSFGNATVWGMEGKQMVHVSPGDGGKGLQQGKGYWIFVK